MQSYVAFGAEHPADSHSAPWQLCGSLCQSSHHLLLTEASRVRAERCVDLERGLVQVGYRNAGIDRAFFRQVVETRFFF